MAYTYRFHKDVGTLHARFSGRVHLREDLDMIDRAAALPEQREGINVIGDFLLVTWFDMDWASQRRLLALMSSLPGWDGLPRSCVILCDGEPIWSFAATIVQQTTLSSPIVFERVKTPVEALRFVGLDPRQHSEKFGYLPVP